MTVLGSKIVMSAYAPRCNRPRRCIDGAARSMRCAGMIVIFASACMRVRCRSSLVSRPSTCVNVPAPRGCPLPFTITPSLVIITCGCVSAISISSFGMKNVTMVAPRCRHRANVSALSRSPVSTSMMESTVTPPKRSSQPGSYRADSSCVLLAR